MNQYTSNSANNIKNNASNNQHHIFDNAFLSACSWDKRLLIPLINEIFHRNYPEDYDIDHSSNEQILQNHDSDEDTLIKRVTDAIIKIDSKNFHFECESKNDGEILIRISEYDLYITLNSAIYNSHHIDMFLPDTAVVFLRNHPSLPKYGTITYHKDDKSLTANIPYFQIGNYNLEYLDTKHLYILFPFYIMRYSSALKHRTSSKYDVIVSETNQVYNVLTKARDDGNITQSEYEHIITLCNYVIDEISKGSEINRKLVNIMGTEVLKTMQEIGEEKGIIKATLSNIKNLMTNMNLSFDKACELLGVKDKEQYRNLI